MLDDTDAAAEAAENRRRYEALRAEGIAGAPRTLPPPTLLDGAPIDPSTVIRRETVPGGWYAPLKLRRGEALRIVNSGGTSAVSVVAWNADDPSERLNYADTIKVQWTAALRKGRVLLSDMGRVLLSIVEDTSGRHDALTGGSTAASTKVAYGKDGLRNTRDNFILASAKLGLARRDIPPCVTFFAPVSVDPGGGLRWEDGIRRAGDFVDLRAEMDLLVAVSNCPHPLDLARPYAPGPVELVRFRAPHAPSDDLCRTATAEAVRAFENTDSCFEGGA
ncbi:urea amidolyase associated protein UAAP1 [Faunimonas sp. B44]|uniref:urea amidolyase associated protein UAAP1 n=1 Tax=Faunimonas sp. B44 TaxID=3461493 RepID=UPI00404399A5